MCLRKAGAGPERWLVQNVAAANLPQANLLQSKDRHAPHMRHPVRRDVWADNELLWDTGSPAFAGDDGPDLNPCRYQA
jgi:hypothetical protein